MLNCFAAFAMTEKIDEGTPTLTLPLSGGGMFYGEGVEIGKGEKIEEELCLRLKVLRRMFRIM